MATKPLPCPTMMRLLANYCPDTGLLTWKSRPLWMFSGSRPKNCCSAWNSKLAGKPAFATDNGFGYLFARARGKHIKAHRAAWAIYYGQWPSGEIDHINRIPNDNSLKNLRLATKSQNARNVRNRAHSSQYRGVTASRGSGVRGGKRWRAQISLDSVRIYLGSFTTEIAAARAYDAAARKMDPEFSILNFPR